MGVPTAITETANQMAERRAARSTSAGTPLIVLAAYPDAERPNVVVIANSHPEDYGSNNATTSKP
jgi:hypothetical protein